MTEPVVEKSNRTFTKRFIILNLVLVWALIILGILTNQAEHVIKEGFALIGVIFGVYTGVGHLDYRRAIDLALDKIATKENDNVG